MLAKQTNKQKKQLLTPQCPYTFWKNGKSSSSPVSKCGKEVIIKKATSDNGDSMNLNAMKSVSMQS